MVDRQPLCPPKQKGDPLLTIHGFDFERAGCDRSHCLTARRKQDVPWCFRLALWKKRRNDLQIFDVVQDEQPASMGDEPLLDRLDDDLLILLLLFWQVKRLCYCRKSSK